MDILRALASPVMDVRRKSLAIALDLITARNIDEVVLVLKKEAVKTESKELEKAAEYRQILIQVWRGRAQQGARSCQISGERC